MVGEVLDVQLAGQAERGTVSCHFQSTKYFLGRVPGQNGNSL
jgi:hypothetical protein